MRRGGVRVRLHVYDLGRTPLSRLQNYFNKDYGAFHTGVEIFGHEWSFGRMKGDQTGVLPCVPKEDPGHAYRETIEMGRTNLSAKEFEQLIHRLSREWHGQSYHLLTRNCHHFSDCLLQELGVGRLPQWCNALAGTPIDMGDWLQNDDTDFDGGAAVVDFVKSVSSSLERYLEHPADTPQRRAQNAPQSRGHRR